MDSKNKDHDESFVYLSDALRDAYMAYKDAAARCHTELRNSGKSPYL